VRCMVRCSRTCWVRCLDVLGAMFGHAPLLNHGQDVFEERPLHQDLVFKDMYSKTRVEFVQYAAAPAVAGSAPPKEQNLITSAERRRTALLMRPTIHHGGCSPCPSARMVSSRTRCWCSSSEDSAMSLAYS